MNKVWISLVAMLIAVSNLSAQVQPVQLGVLAPDNLKKPRPKAPFDLTGAWLHAGESERFDPPAGFKLTPEAQKHYDAAQQATKEGKLYKNDIGLCWPAGVPRHPVVRRLCEFRRMWHAPPECAR